MSVGPNLFCLILRLVFSITCNSRVHAVPSCLIYIWPKYPITETKQFSTEISDFVTETFLSHVHIICPSMDNGMGCSSLLWKYCIQLKLYVAFSVPEITTNLNWKDGGTFLLLFSLVIERRVDKSNGSVVGHGPYPGVSKNTVPQIHRYKPVNLHIIHVIPHFLRRCGQFWEVVC